MCCQEVHGMHKIHINHTLFVLTNAAAVYAFEWFTCIKQNGNETDYHPSLFMMHEDTLL